MKPDIESRRLAIIHALRGRDSAPDSPRLARDRTPPAPPTSPVDVAPSAIPAPLAPTAEDLGALSATVSDLAVRVDQIARDLSGLHKVSAVRHHIPMTPYVPDDDEPVTRSSVPPVFAAKISDRAFDVLLGRP